MSGDCLFARLIFLVAVLYCTVWLSGILSLKDFILGIVAFGPLTHRRIQPWQVVVLIGRQGLRELRSRVGLVFQTPACQPTFFSECSWVVGRFAADEFPHRAGMLKQYGLGDPQVARLYSLLVASGIRSPT